MKNLLFLILDPLKDVYHRSAELLPNLAAMIVIMLAGIVMAQALRFVLLKLLKAINFNTWSDRMGLTSMLRKCDVWARPADAMAVFLFWSLIVMSFLSGLTALQIRFVDAVIAGVMGYLPKVVSAVLILIVGYIATGLIAQALLISLVNSGFSFARYWVRAVRSLLLMLLVAMALEQLQVAPNIVVAAFSIFFGGAILALAISFGVAGIDTAKRMLEAQEERKREAHETDLQHL